MRRPPITAILTVGACALGLVAPATAQTPASQAAPSSAGAAGLRYLTWPGRTYRPASVTAPTTASAAPGLVSTQTRPPIIPRGGQAAPAPAATPSTNDIPSSQGLTPASAWVSPQAPAYQPRPAAPVDISTARPYYASAPVAAAAPAPAQPVPQPAAWSRTRAPAPTPAAPQPAPSAYFTEAAEAAPIIAPTPAPTPAPLPAPTASASVESAPVDAPAPDPMAPRRDALIFTLQRPAAAPAAEAPTAQPQAAATPAAAETPAPQGSARYYSVHRQAGRQPDATPLPAPVYLDALPVDLTTTPASPDLAEPPAAPNLIRNANGRLQALPANEDPILP